MGDALVKFGMDHPRLVTGAMAAMTLLLAVLAALPSLWPETFPMLQPVPCACSTTR